MSEGQTEGASILSFKKNTKARFSQQQVEQEEENDRRNDVSLTGRSRSGFLLGLPSLSAPESPFSSSGEQAVLTTQPKGTSPSLQENSPALTALFHSWVQSQGELREGRRTVHRKPPPSPDLSQQSSSFRLSTGKISLLI